MILQLTEASFTKTFGKKMTDVSTTASPVVDIWNYVEELAKLHILDCYVFENNIVEKVYRNDLSTFEHVVLPTEKEQVFITIVIDIQKKSILGHYFLDMKKEC